MTAGHNALRGSGPDQKLAFDDAVALVGCPDHRIDPALHYVLFALPTFTSRRMSGAISFTPQARRVVCNARPCAAKHAASRSDPPTGRDGAPRGLAGDDAANAVTLNEGDWSRAACEQVDW